MKKRIPNIIEAVGDPRLIADAVSPGQEAALRALYGLPLSGEGFALYQQATGRPAAPDREFREASYICGRRGGKSSKLAANIAVYEAAFRKHRLARGERGYIVVIATTRKQAGVCFEYILSRLEHSPTLRALVAGEPRADEVDLTNGITIAVWPCSFRSIRGISIVCAICDEIAFWRDDLTGANPASEVLRAIRPAMVTFPSAKLIKISSPYAKQGVVWDDWQARNSRPDVLVWRAATALMNPAIDGAFLAGEKKRDPEAFAREYEAEFWESASSLLPPDAIEACVVPARRELPPLEGIGYTAALDAAFRGDNFAFTIVHMAKGGKVAQDVMRSWRGSRAKPVDLATTLGEIVATMRRYRAGTIYGDQFCSEPIRQALAAQGIKFEQANTLGSRAATLWNTLRALVAAGDMELLDDPEQTAELKRLELVVTASGNQRVEATSGHDDKAVALALAAHQAISRPILTPWVAVVRVGDSGIAERGWTRIA